MRDLVGDAWDELSGYDGRFARTFRQLLGRPGALTVEVLEGHRARYVSPVRLYLVASVFYFLLAAGTPNINQPPPPRLPGSNVTIDFTNPETSTSQLSAEDRAEILRAAERAPWWMRSAVHAAVSDPAGFRRRFLETLPRMLFALVPVFAAILALFYRRRPFSQHLIFALHLHAMIFIAQAAREAVNWTGSRVLLTAIEVGVLIYIAAYALAAFRRVYRERWPWILAKSTGIALLYGLVGFVGILGVVAWATLK